MTNPDASRPCISCKHHDRYRGTGTAKSRLVCTLPKHKPSVEFERDDVVENGRDVPKCGPSGANWVYWEARA